MQAFQGFSRFQVTTLGRWFAECVLLALIPDDLTAILFQVYSHGDVIGEGEHDHREVVDLPDEVEKEGGSVLTVAGFVEQSLFGGQSFLSAEDFGIGRERKCMAGELQQVFYTLRSIHSIQFPAQLADE